MNTVLEITQISADKTQVLKINEQQRLVIALFLIGALEACSKRNLNLEELVTREVADSLLHRFTGCDFIKPGKVRKYILQRFETVALVYFTQQPNSKMEQLSEPYNHVLLRDMIDALRKQVIK